MPTMVLHDNVTLRNVRHSLKQNQESTKGYWRLKVELRHGKFEESGLNNWSKIKSQNGLTEVRRQSDKNGLDSFT